MCLYLYHAMEVVNFDVIEKHGACGPEPPPLIQIFSDFRKSSTHVCPVIILTTHLLKAFHLSPSYVDQLLV